MPKLTGHWLFWVRQPPLLIPAVPHGEQEIRQGEQKFSPQLPGSAPAQEIERRTPGTPPTIAADQPFPPFPLLPAGEAAQTSPNGTREHLGLPSHQTCRTCRLFHRGAQLSSSWVLGRRPLLFCAMGRVESRLPSCLAHGTSPPRGSQVCMPAKGKPFSTEQTALLQRDCYSSRHLSLACTTNQRQPQH